MKDTTTIVSETISCAQHHKTHDMLHVQKTLGHRNIKSTMQHINLEAAIYHGGNVDDFHLKVADTVEASKLIETIFEYLTNMD